MPKIVNKGKKVVMEPFSTKRVDGVACEKTDGFFHVKLDIDNSQGQIDVVLDRRTFETLVNEFQRDNSGREK